MFIIPSNNLNSELLRVVKTTEKLGIEINDIFKVMYWYGLRISEATQLHKISMDNYTTHVSILCPKTRTVRIITKGGEGTNALNRLIANKNGYHPEPSRILRICKQLLRYRNVTIGDKPCYTHLFRHNRAKQMKLSNYTISGIAAFYSITTSVANRYVSSVIVATQYMQVIP
jgi:site-specific recombinase XerC